MIECLNFQIIMIFFTFSEFFDSEKKNVERELVFSKKIMSFFLSAIFIFLMKNLFLVNLSAFCFSVSSIILMIQFSVFLKVLFSDFLKFVFSIFLFVTDLSVSVFLILFLVNMSMCFQCSKILRIDALIQCVRSNKYVKCICCSAEKVVCLVMNLFLKHKLFTVDNSRFLLFFSLNCYEFKS